jgi:uncharacterized protein
MTSTNVETIVKLYEAFDKKDIPTLVSYFADDITWDVLDDNQSIADGAVPWLKPRRGKDDVSEFFPMLARSVKFSKFDVNTFMGGTNKVAVELTTEVEFLEFNTQVNEVQIHLWTLNDDGKVIAFRHFVDTAKHIAAAKGEKILV